MNRNRVYRIVVVHFVLLGMALVYVKLGLSKFALTYYEKPWNVVFDSFYTIWSRVLIQTAIYAYLDGRWFFRKK